MKEHLQVNLIVTHHARARAQYQFKCNYYSENMRKGNEKEWRKGKCITRAKMEM
jgi:hypothetical protein